MTDKQQSNLELILLPVKQSSEDQEVSDIKEIIIGAYWNKLNSEYQELSNKLDLVIEKIAQRKLRKRVI